MIKAQVLSRRFASYATVGSTTANSKIVQKLWHFVQFNLVICPIRQYVKLINSLIPVIAYNHHFVKCV